MYSVRWDSVKDNKPKPHAQSWAELREMLSYHAVRADKYKGHLYSAVTYVEGASRGNKNVLAVNAFVADLDGEALEDTLEILQGYEFITYTTHSHRTDDQHWHIVIPFSQPVPSHEWFSVWKQMHELLGIEGDPQTSDPARIFFAPQHAPGADWDMIAGDGILMDPPAFRFQDRPVVSAKPRTQSSAPVYLGCRCTLKKVCAKCEIEFEQVSLDRYNGFTQKEIRADIRAEFLALVGEHLGD